MIGKKKISKKVFLHILGLGIFIVLGYIYRVSIAAFIIWFVLKLNT